MGPIMNNFGTSFLLVPCRRRMSKNVWISRRRFLSSSGGLGLDLESKVRHYGESEIPRPSHIHNLVLFAQRQPEAKSFSFMKREIPVRLANTILEFGFIPQRLSKEPLMEEVRAMYEKSFRDVVAFEDAEEDDPEALYQFTETLKSVRSSLSDTVSNVGLALKGYSRDEGGVIWKSSHLKVQYFVNRLFMSKLGLRMLINQHCRSERHLLLIQNQ